MKLETLTQVNAERAARRPVIVITDTANGDQRLVKTRLDGPSSSAVVLVRWASAQGGWRVAALDVVARDARPG